MAANLRPIPYPKPAHGFNLNPAEVERTFRDKVQHFTVTPRCSACSGCGRPYIQVQKLRHWLKEKCSKKPDTTWADQCLEAANKGHNVGSWSLSDINLDGRECLLVFSILYDIGEPGLIKHFRSHDLTDKKLPISLLELETKLKGSTHDSTLLAQKFDMRQWAFCSYRFDWSSQFNFEKPTILPICRRGILSRSGGTALVWQIAIQEEFVGDSLRKISAKSRFHDNEFGVVGHCSEHGDGRLTNYSPVLSICPQDLSRRPYRVLPRRA